MAHTIVIGDVHLHPRRERGVGEDLAALLRASDDHHVIFAGDLFELAMCAGVGPAERIDALVAAFPNVFEAMRAPRSVTFVAGNHDAGIAAPAAAERLRAAVGREIVVERWFARRGEVHVEHGNQYDPDNAFDDPENPRHLPLGSFMMERCLRHIGALDYLEDVDKRPGWVLWRTIYKFGPRAPMIIGRYLWSSILAVVHAGDPVERPDDDPAKSLFAWPTTASRWETFHRLYLGRLATAAALIAAAIWIFHQDWVGGWVASGVAALGILALARKSHVRGRVQEALAQAGHRIAAFREAGAVVFGHAHHAVEEPPYYNTGSFGLPRERAGRPYLIIEDEQAPRLTRAFWPKTAPRARRMPRWRRRSLKAAA